MLLGEDGDVGQGLVRAAADGSQPGDQARVDQLGYVRVTFLP